MNGVLTLRSQYQLSYHVFVDVNDDICLIVFYVLSFATIKLEHFNHSDYVMSHRDKKSHILCHITAILVVRDT